MSTKNVKESVVEVMCKFALTRKVMDKLGLTDQGKIDKFYETVIEEEKDAIEQIESDLEINAITYKNDVKSLNRKLEDAKNALEECYSNVLPEKVQTNALATEYVKIFWKNITEAQNKVDYIEEELKKVKEQYDEETEELKKQITKRKTRIDKITKQ